MAPRNLNKSVSFMDLAMNPKLADDIEKRQKQHRNTSFSMNPGRIFQSWVKTGMTSDHELDRRRAKFKEDFVETEFISYRQESRRKTMGKFLSLYTFIFLILQVLRFLTSGDLTRLLFLIPLGGMLLTTLVPKLHPYLEKMVLVTPAVAVLIGVTANMIDLDDTINLGAGTVVRRVEVTSIILAVAWSLILTPDVPVALCWHIVYCTIICVSYAIVNPHLASTIFLYAYVSNLFIGFMLGVLLYFYNMYQRQLFGVSLKVLHTRLALERQQRKLEGALANILPTQVFERLQSALKDEQSSSKGGKTLVYDSFGVCSVVQLDIVGFTTLSSTKKPAELVKFLNALFFKLDDLVVQRLRMEKIKV